MLEQVLGLETNSCVRLEGGALRDDTKNGCEGD